VNVGAIIIQQPDAVTQLVQNGISGTRCRWRRYVEEPELAAVELGREDTATTK
jgi:hypothetical protein